MTAARKLEAPERPRLQPDQTIVLRGLTWSDYQRMLEIRGERATPRIIYSKGAIELMSPSISHESIKSLIGRLIETWCLERGVEFAAYGSWTLEDKAADRGVEPDECYVFGDAVDPKRPDLAIEVVWTSGGIDKLEAYAALGVREVWYWEREHITIHVLRGGGYEEASKSDVLPELDLAVLESFLDRPRTSAAIRDYRAALRGPTPT